MPWWWVLIGAALIGSLGIAVVAYVPLWMGMAFAALTVAGVVGALAVYSLTPITVDGEWFRVGRYRIERCYIARATALTGQAASAAVGPGADHRAFLFTRPYVKDLVRVDLDDEADPHPYWLISSRRATELAAALGGES